MSKKKKSRTQDQSSFAMDVDTDPPHVDHDTEMTEAPSQQPSGEKQPLESRRSQKAKRYAMRQAEKQQSQISASGNIIPEMEGAPQQHTMINRQKTKSSGQGHAQDQGTADHHANRPRHPKTTPAIDPDSPLAATELATTLRKRLPWSTEKIMSCLNEYASPFIQQWHDQCYIDKVLYRKLIKKTKKASREKLVSDIFATCKRAGKALLRTSLFAGEYGDVSMHIAQAAVKINNYSFKNVEWAAPFALGDDAGYLIAVELVLDVFEDLEQDGGNGWAEKLLEDAEEESKGEVTESAKSGGGGEGLKTPVVSEVDMAGGEDGGTAGGRNMDDGANIAGRGTEDRLGSALGHSPSLAIRPAKRPRDGDDASLGEERHGKAARLEL